MPTTMRCIVRSRKPGPPFTVAVVHASPLIVLGFSGHWVRLCIGMQLWLWRSFGDAEKLPMLVS